MRIIKETSAGVLSAEDSDLEAIAELSKRPLSAEEVFTFAVLLCDNEVDRDHERFTTDALYELAPMFVGRTGISDHVWSTHEQKARIYRTEVLTDEGRVTACGEPYTYIKAYAYMLRTESNAELIAEIEGGIKKEVSVGCSVSEVTCSICGEEMGSTRCGHVRGREYDGRVCTAELSRPTDAYEWSFVAVPAQTGAGVLKKTARQGSGTLREFIEQSGQARFMSELGRLETEAEFGRSCLEKLRADAVRLGLLTRCGMDADTINAAAKAMTPSELSAMVEKLERRADEMLPPVTQLPPFSSERSYQPEEEFLI